MKAFKPCQCTVIKKKFKFNLNNMCRIFQEKKIIKLTLNSNNSKKIFY